MNDVPESNYRNQIIIALISFAGVVLAAVITSLNNTTSNSRDDQNSTGSSNSPNISAEGDVSVTISGDKSGISTSYLSELIGKEPFL